MRVVIADDEALVRAGIRSILASDASIEIVAEGANGREAIDAIQRHRPDVALLDIQMPRVDGLQALEEIRRTAPDTAVLLLTTFSDDAYISRALSGGASGFLLKSGDPQELLAGLRAAADGAAFLSPRVAKRVIATLGSGAPGLLARETEARERTSTLTTREREVLALLASGMSNAQIGSTLFLVEGTVKAYVSTILSRLGVRNRVQAAIIAYEAGMITT